MESGETERERQRIERQKGKDREWRDRKGKIKSGETERERQRVERQKGKERVDKQE